MNKDSITLANSFLSLMTDGAITSESEKTWTERSDVSVTLITATVSAVKNLRLDLWNGTCLKNGPYPSHSEADYALCGCIAREAMKLGAQIEHLSALIKEVFRKSALYREEKWKTTENHTIPKIVASFSKQPHNLSTPAEAEASKSDHLSAENLLQSMLLSESHVKEMQDAVFIIEDMIVRGHMMAFVAPANSGKTALLVHFSEQIVSAGYHLLYVNCDASPPDLRRHFEHAQRHKYKVVAPDVIPGKSPRDVLAEFKRFLEHGVDLSNVVIVLDTLKKFVDVIEKRAAKELYSLLRGLSVRGCTVILLGHCNKHLDHEKRTLYEGTADLRNDLDELIYLDAQKDAAGKGLSITTRPDKVRADIKVRSFFIHLPDRRVEELDKPVRILSKRDEEVLELSALGIFLGNTSQKDLVQFVLSHVTSGIGEKKVKQIISVQTTAMNRITVRRSGRAKDLVFGLTTEERALQESRAETQENSPF